MTIVPTQSLEKTMQPFVCPIRAQCLDHMITHYSRKQRRKQFIDNSVQQTDPADQIEIEFDQIILYLLKTRQYTLHHKGD